jgi:hypothetical protein
MTFSPLTSGNDTDTLRGTENFLEPVAQVTQGPDAPRR